MAKRATITTKEYLKSVPLPQYEGGSYTVISHDFVMHHALESLASKGFEVKNELYRCNKDGDIAQAIYHINYQDDPELGMMFAWANSYDKSMRFKCAIGAYVLASHSTIVRGDMGSWGRKHTGTADEETITTIHSQVSNAHIYYKQLIQDKDAMKTIKLSKKDAASLCGQLFFNKHVLNTEQLTTIKQQIEKPSYVYGGDSDSLWHLYNHIIFALKKAHPKDWMDHQKLIHWYLTSEFNLVNLDLQEASDNRVTEVKSSTEAIQAPNQLTILDAIQEIEKENNEENNLNNL